MVTAFSDRSIDQLSTLFSSQDQWLYFNKPFTHAELLQAAANLVNAWNRRRQLECHDRQDRGEPKETPGTAGVESRGEDSMAKRILRRPCW